MLIIKYLLKFVFVKSVFDGGGHAVSVGIPMPVSDQETEEQVEGIHHNLNHYIHHLRLVYAFSSCQLDV